MVNTVYITFFIEATNDHARNMHLGCKRQAEVTLQWQKGIQVIGRQREHPWTNEVC